MNGLLLVSLVVLCVAALGLVAAVISTVTTLALPLLDRVTALLAPRQRVRAWLWVAALPALFGVATVLATLLPAFGLGTDHCLAHDPHHPHLCPHHLAAMPGAVLIALAALIATRFIYAVAGFVRAARLGATTSRTLGEASVRRGDVLMFEAVDPQAFVLGVMSPTVHASRGLLSMDETVVDPVLAHERAHARARDSLWRALCPVLAALHLPFAATRIARRLSMAQEMAADEEAACALGDRTRVAESLIALAKRQVRCPAPGLSFADGDIGARVRALIAPPRRPRAWPLFALSAAVTTALVAIAASHQSVHHAVETLLGILG